MKKMNWKQISIIVCITVLLGAAYIYQSSLEEPTDTVVATVTTPESDTTISASGDMALSEQSVQGLPSGTIEQYNIVSGAVLGRKATKPVGFHTGEIDITTGSVLITNRTVVGGSFDFDMTSITLLDSDNPKLLGEIKNDLFETNTYPTSHFTITKVEESATSGTIVYGDLTIKNVTKSISFPAIISMKDEPVSVQASFAINRLDWGLTMWEGIANNFIEYTIDLTLNR